MDSYITRAEHEEFRRNMENEHHRASKRLDIVEEEAKQIYSLVTSVEKLAIIVGNIEKKQQSDNEIVEKVVEKVEIIGEADGKKWRKLVGYVITGLAGSVVTFLMQYIGGV